MRKINVIALVQLPPPVHGAAVINQRVTSILDSSRVLGCKVIRLNYARNFQEMHAPAFKKVLYTLSILIRLLKYFLVNRPAVTYIAFSPFGVGFYRDLFFVALARLFCSKPYLHLHGTGLSNEKSKIKAILLRWMLKRSRLILIAPSLYRDVDNFTHLERTVVIENCVDDPGEYTKKRSSIIRILYLANLDERKGVKTAISIYSKIRELGYSSELVIAGSDTVHLSKNDLELYINYKYPAIADGITVCGPVYGPAKAELFLNADLFLYPSMHDASPLVVLEALSYGVPVVSSNQGALPDMIAHGDSGFISSENEINQYVGHFISCVDNLAAHSLSARKSYLSKYSPSVFKDKVERLFLNNY